MREHKISVGDLVIGVTHKTNSGYTFSAEPSAFGLVIKVTEKRIAHVLYDNHIFAYDFKVLKIVSKCVNTIIQKAA